MAMAVRLIVAGGAAVAGVAVLAAVARAGAEDPAEQADVLLSGAVINRMLGKRLPISFDVPAERASGAAALGVTLVEGRYCGAMDTGHGRLIGVLRPAGAATAPPLL